MTEVPNIEIPDLLLPEDGRFGSGPSRTRFEALEDLGKVAELYLGTSHRQPQVMNLVRLIRLGLREFFSAPEGYEVVLGNGGSTYFWDVATFSLIRRRSQHLSFGEFSAKFAAGVAAVPFLEPPTVFTAPPGSLCSAVAEDDVDVYAWPQNETSTGVMAPVRRVPDAAADALMVIDATSAAGGLPVDLAETDVYYFAPQKSFAGEGGLWVAVLSPLALARVAEIKASGRWIPPSLDLSLAIEYARKDQTLNTPAIATLFLLAHQVDWLVANGNLAGAVRRTRKNARILYSWAEKSSYATPFVTDPAARSLVVGTVDLDPSIDAALVAKVLRANHIVDTEPYRKLGRNQLRVGLFPVTPAGDVQKLTACIDYVVDHLPRR